MKYVFTFLSLCMCCICIAQQDKQVNFISANANITIVPDSSLVDANITYNYTLLKPLDSVKIDAKNMQILQVSSGNTPLGYVYNNKQIIFKPTIKVGDTAQIYIRYKTQPQKALYILKRKKQWNIWTQGQGKYTSNWLPSFDNVNQKAVFNLNVTFSSNYTVLANGKLHDTTSNLQNTTWHYRMLKPMSSYLVALAIGKYAVTKQKTASGIPLQLYYFEDEQYKTAATYKYTQRIFNVLEHEIGVPYPWQNYKQAPAHDFLYAGMENTSLTLFSDAYVVDEYAFNDDNYINVNAHELAHQWFGNLVTAKSGEHHWLQEGFATYYALLAERDIFGKNYFNFKLYQSAQQLQQQTLNNTATSVLNPKSTSVTFYQRGAWVLHMLRQKVGDSVFKASVKTYLNTYKHSSAATDNFIDIVEDNYNKPLTNFVKTWLLQPEFPFDEAVNWLKTNSTYIQEYIMADCELKSSKCNDYLKYGLSDDAKAKIIAQIPSVVTPDAFKSSIKVRQAIAKHVTKIPYNLKASYETLLNDASYTTIESALYNLWINFPKEGVKYLAKTKQYTSSNAYSLRMLWLVLHLNTPEYQTQQKSAVLTELKNYTNPSYNANVRMKAFYYLNLIKQCKAQCIQNLNQAKMHHNWRMIKFAKQFEQQLIKANP